MCINYNVVGCTRCEIWVGKIRVGEINGSDFLIERSTSQKDNTGDFCNIDG